MKNEVRAYVKNLDVAPRKARSIVDLIRGRSAPEAEAELVYRKERAARPILKLLRSALANARVKQADPDALFVKTIHVDKGMTLKRILPRAQGAASPIHKVRSHVTIILAEGSAPSRFKLMKKAVQAVGKQGAKKEQAKGDDKAKADVEPQEAKVEVKTKSPFTHRLFRRKTG